MSKVLEFFGMGKKVDNTQKVLTESAKIQNEKNSFGDVKSGNQANLEKQPTNFGKSTPIFENSNAPKKTNFFDSSNQVKQMPDVSSTRRNEPEKTLSDNKNQNLTRTSNPSPFQNSRSGNFVAPKESSSGYQTLTPQIQPQNIDYASIKMRLTNLVDKTFPSPFPSRISHAEDFDKSLINKPFPSNHIDFLLENSKYNNKSKENQINKFMNYKKETEFYKKYINMNEIKKQKLMQEIEDHKRRQGIYNNMNPNDPEYKHLEEELRMQEHMIQQETEELDYIRSQIGSDHADVNQSYQYHAESPHSTPPVYVPDSQSYKEQGSLRNNQNQHGGHQNYTQQGHVNSERHLHSEPPQTFYQNNNQNESQDWGNQYQQRPAHNVHQAYTVQQNQGSNNQYIGNFHEPANQRHLDLNQSHNFLDNILSKDASVHYNPNISPIQMHAKSTNQGQFVNNQPDLRKQAQVNHFDFDHQEINNNDVNFGRNVQNSGQVYQNYGSSRIGSQYQEVNNQGQGGVGQMGIQSAIRTGQQQQSGKVIKKDNPLLKKI